MIAPEAIRDLLSQTVIAKPTEDGVQVSTHVLYPSNGAVSVVIRGGESSFVISDEGGALGELISAGIRTIVADRMINAQVKRRGLRVDNGAILSPIIPLKAIPAAILLVANASRDVADWGLSRFPYHVARNFKKDLADLLGHYFHDNLKNDTHIIGKSNKAHRFTHVIYLSGQRRLLVDPVINDSSSINSRLVANLDVRLIENPLIQQLIVFDDHLKWKGSDLKLLELGATTLPFSQAEPEIKRLAA